MYKLILVDDEEEVRKGILEKIEWNKYGFEILGEAENGIEALEIAERVVPDVVITDIKMPFMDGLTLAERLKEKYPTTKVVILTGFDEFEYAKEAIRYNVIEYALKPISSRELSEVLQKIKDRMDDEIAQKKDMDKLKEHYLKSFPLLRENFLCSLVGNRLGNDEITEKANLYGLESKGNGYVAAVVNIDFNIVNPTNVMQEWKHAEEIDGEAYGNSELLKLSIFNICKETIKRNGFGTVFLNNDYIVIIFNTEFESHRRSIDKITSYLEEIRQSIIKFYGFSVTMGVGSPYKSLSELHYSYKEALTALDYKLIMGRNKIICIDDIEPRKNGNLFFDELKEKQLTSSIKVGTTEELNRTIDSLFEELDEDKVSFKDCQIYLLQMLTSILKTARDLNIDTDSIIGDNYSIFVDILKLNDLQEIYKCVVMLCMKIKNSISRERQDNCKQIVKEAVEYLHSNFEDSDITIDYICSKLHISAAYFSTIFKKETKLTFVNYLTKIRMEAAKELLRTTDCKTFEIAKRVGFAEPNYFSYCFKKKFGVSPSQYRNNIV